MRITLSFILLLAGISTAVYAQNGDTVTFEKNRQLVHLDTAQHPNIWQIGKPRKPYFDSAYSKPYAILTDTVNPYPINNTSSFILSGLKVCASCAIIMSFYHKYETDSLKDGGYIEYSIDTGKTWKNISNYSACTSSWDTITGGIPAFTGKSNGWQPFHCFFCGLSHSNYDSVIFRFTFKSGPTFANKDGWMIDNISLATDICEGVQDYAPQKAEINLYPNPASTRVNITYKLPASSSQAALCLYNTTGQLLRKENINPDEETITENIASLPDGVYYYSLVVSGATEAINKLVIIK